MDSNTRLDYALFQLTPTRTRCDLVVFSGGKSEKLASGLVEPFISHLRSAKDQIPKGGYSITLRALTPNASWFTKGTLERFVRFVTTPEVLERFVTIEKEILQIENSVQRQSNELAKAAEEDADNNSKKSIVPFKAKGEPNGVDVEVQEENSKRRLQRVLETRKAVLRKEQAMAYARAFVAGFDMECIDELIVFADAFGASRLREACINFKDLCNKKHGDGLWMDELAAMEVSGQQELPYLATSGIILSTDNSIPSGLDASASESTASPASSDINQGQVPPTTAKGQFPMSWPNQFPQYMYNFQGPSMHQMPPYQGYPFPGMQVPPHYQGNMQWHPNMEEYSDGSREPNHRRNSKSSSRKKEQEAHSEPTDSTSGSDLDAYLQEDGKGSSTEKKNKRKNGKKSSRMVVIRNINYITSKKKDGESDESSLDEDELMDGNSLKQRLEDAVGSMEKYHESTSHHHKKTGGKKSRTIANKPNGEINEDLVNDLVDDVSDGVNASESWGAFQNLLLKDDDSSPKQIQKQQTLDVQDEYFTIQSSISGTPFPANQTVDIETEKGPNRRMVATDAFVVTEREGHESSRHVENFENGENFRPSMKNRDYMDDEMLFSHRGEEVGRKVQVTVPDYDGESSVIKTQKGEDWFIVNQSGNSVGTDAAIESSIFDGDKSLTFGGDYIQTEKNRKDVFVDDSFMVQARSIADDQPDSQWRTDISMFSGLTSAPNQESDTHDTSGDSKLPGTYEPDDLCMVLVRDSGPEPAMASWTPEVDYEMDVSFKESDKKQSIVDTDGISDDKPEVPETKPSGKEAKSKPLRGSLSRSRTEIISRNGKPSTVSRVAVHKSKAEREEENRKKMEELAIERQKRIAERSASNGFSPITSKKAPVESKKTITALKNDKQTARSGTQDSKRLSMHKPTFTSSTIDRLAAVKPKESPSAPLKSSQPKKTGSKVNGIVAATSSPRTSRDVNQKSGSNLPKPLNKSNEDISTSSDAEKKQAERHTSQDLRPLNGLEALEDHAPPQPSPTLLKIEQKNISDVHLVNNGFSEAPVGLKSALTVNEPSVTQDSVKSEDDDSVISVAHPVLQEEKNVGEKNVGFAVQANGFTTETKVGSLPEEPKYSVNSSTVNLEGTRNKGFSVSDEISEEEIIPYPVESTPPSSIELNPESTPTRKKWNSSENSPSAAKGLKKLLMFGRKKPILSA